MIRIMKIIGVFALAIVGVCLLSVIGKLAPGIGKVISVVLAGVFVALGLSLLSSVVDELGTLFESDSYKNGVKVMLKSLGITLCASFATDICRDYGESTIAGAVDLVAKCELIAIAFPLWKNIVTLALSMLEQ